MTDPVPLPFLPLALPAIGEEEIAEVVDTLRSGRLGAGSKARRFEDEFVAFFGTPPLAAAAGAGALQAVAVDSSLAGLHLSLEALGVGPGDEVIVPTLCHAAAAAAVRHLGAEAVPVDIDPATLNVDPQAVEAAVRPATRAVVPVHFAGLAADMKGLLAVARRHGLKVVEDAAHALPATLDGEAVGTLGSDACVFSFHPAGPITTGAGGMIVSRDEALARRARTMRAHGSGRAALDRVGAPGGDWWRETVAAGFDCAMGDLAASLGLRQLRRAHALRHRRAEIAAQYDAAFVDLPLVAPPRARAGDVHAWTLYPIRLVDGAPLSRDAFVERMAAAGIGCGVHFVPLHLQPYWRDRYGLEPGRFPAAQHAAERIVSLPIRAGMDEGEVDRVIDAVRGLLAV